MAFEEQSTKGDAKAGFETYADGIRIAEQKLAHAGVIMSDEEKKEKFFAGFNPRSAQWNSSKTFWMQSDHTFDDILSRGVQQTAAAQFGRSGGGRQCVGCPIIYGEIDARRGTRQ